MSAGPGGYPPISAYAFLSDCHTAALIGPDGTAEWMCVPRFDGPGLFTRILDRSTGGWELTVDGADPPERRYVGDSLVLESRWQAPHGTLVGHDFLAVKPAAAAGDRGIVSEGMLVRLVRCESGRATVRFRTDARPDYGRGEVHWTDAGEALVSGDGALWLAGEPAPVVAEDGTAGSVVELAAGDAAVLALGYRGGPSRRMDRATAERLLSEATDAWQAWSDRADYHGVAEKQVRQSAVVLRGLLLDETGGLLAAPTTSLPEWIGGRRNWDYRYVWHRDAALVVLVLLRLGHAQEAGRYLHFLLANCALGEDKLKPMLTLDGGTAVEEESLHHLDGYAGSRPVRIGNEAFEQHQLDAYGHVLDAAYVYQEVTGDLTPGEISELRRMVDVLAGRWREPDHGVWEVRSDERHWTYSKLYAWACLDRGIMLAELCEDADAPVERWRTERDAVREEILERGYDEEIGSFVQSYGARNVDASTLHLPLLGLLKGDDPRVVSTLERIEEELGEGGFLIHRYDPEVTDDGIGEPEGAFLMCSFDMVSALVLAGRSEEAQERFDKLCAHTGPLGLLSEEMTADGTFLGNFPQAFTHLALIEAAMNLDQAGRSDALHDWADRQRR
ncbi:glycoside hydrolase family 15 protein [Streptomyces sp. ACA25]|uniref:glycoside hydrolase family 15 protein n=1 Tax=Streptomyces sp. ACA25 TaxID=3022596 RepID=UPI00230718B3|nr:glycoside hydrolase family 15 protein [Streptomyces sp. ACA25]MDB1089842.1 glycoside hydrolase family 15 protein [Streptomyces sp. ACA25]